MKQETKLVAIILAALIVFLSGFGLGATRGITIKVEGGAAVQTGGTQTVAPAEQTTTAPPAAEQTTAPAAEQTTAPAADNSGASSTSVPSTKAEIAAAYNKAINDLRAYQGKVTMKKSDDVKIEVTDLPALAATAINAVVKNFTGVTTSEYTFENGVDVNDPNRKLVEKIIPWNRDANVQEAGLVSASATPNADGGYTMTMTFVAEDSKFDGTKNTSEPTYHMGAMDPLNLASIDLGDVVSITSADLHYPGATLTATVDGQGRIVKIDNKLPLEGSGSGKAVISLTINMKGSMDSAYELIYA
ncbi:MAG: hypothetical protein IJ349_07055 [Clostridia bacterium]|nr:hypothetical protein [Clostridia bacterium]